NPEFNVWTAIEPYAKRLTSKSVNETVKLFAQQALETAALVVKLPRQIEEMNTLLQQGKLSVKTPGVDARLHALERLGQRAVSAIIFAGLLLGGIFLKRTDEVFGW